MEIKTKHQTEHGDIGCSSRLFHQKNGQLTIEVTGEHEDFQHQHTITVGAEDGNDALSKMTEEEIQAHLQSHLNTVRQKTVETLTARVRVKKCSAPR